MTISARFYRRLALVNADVDTYEFYWLSLASFSIRSRHRQQKQQLLPLFPLYAFFSRHVSCSASWSSSSSLLPVMIIKPVYTPAIISRSKYLCALVYICSVYGYVRVRLRVDTFARVYGPL